MRERLSNRWLNDQLIAPKAGRRARKAISRLTAEDFIMSGAAEVVPASWHRRRTWQYLATLALLIGSGAFSVIVWA